MISSCSTLHWEFRLTVILVGQGTGGEGTQAERDSFHSLVRSPSSCNAWAGPARSLELLPGHSCGYQRLGHPGSSSEAFPGALAGSWVRNRAAGTCTSAHMISLLFHHAGPSTACFKKVGLTAKTPTSLSFKNCSGFPGELKSDSEVNLEKLDCSSRRSFYTKRLQRPELS